MGMNPSSKRLCRILLFSGLVLVVSGVIWKFRHSNDTIVPHGNLSANDVAEIRSVVKREMRGNIFPDFSWASFKGLPAHLKEYMQYKIMFVEEAHPAGVVVEVRTTNQRSSGSLLVMTKGTNGWQMGPTDITIVWGGSDGFFISSEKDVTISIDETNLPIVR